MMLNRIMSARKSFYRKNQISRAASAVFGGIFVVFGAIGFLVAYMNGPVVWLSLFPLIFVAVGLMVIRAAYRQKSSSTEFLPVSGGRPNWLPAPAQPADGSRVLKPSMTPRALFIATLVFALFWNGFVSIFVYQIVTSFRQADPEWVMTIFMIPFVVVGLVVFGLAVRQFLALFNPTIVLSVDRAEVLPGDLLQISWQIEGAVDRLKKLELTFVGEEAATYRRGTSSHTDRHEFQKIPVYQTEMIGPIGAASLRIPEDAMHSFKAPNNVIAWKLKFHGDVPRWPDVDVDYEIVVIPRGAPRD